MDPESSLLNDIIDNWAVSIFIEYVLDIGDHFLKIVSGDASNRLDLIFERGLGITGSEFKYYAYLVL